MNILLLHTDFRGGRNAAIARQVSFAQITCTVLVMSADWHELMIPQRTMRPLNSSVSEQLDKPPADIPPPPQSATRLWSNTT